MNNSPRTPVGSAAVYRRVYGRKAWRPVEMVDRPHKSLFLVTKLYLGTRERPREK